MFVKLKSNFDRNVSKTLFWAFKTIYFWASSDIIIVTGGACLHRLL